MSETGRFIEGTEAWYGELVSEGLPPSHIDEEWQKRVAAEALAETVTVDPATLAVERSPSHAAIIGEVSLYERVIDAVCPPACRDQSDAPANWSKIQWENVFGVAVRIGAGLQGRE